MRDYALDDIRNKQGIYNEQQAEGQGEIGSVANFGDSVSRLCVLLNRTWWRSSEHLRFTSGTTRGFETKWQIPRQTFVEQGAHSGVGNQQFTGLFQQANGLVPADGREIPQKIVQRVSPD